jgi:hypothetical protein
MAIMALKKIFIALTEFLYIDNNMAAGLICKDCGYPDGIRWTNPVFTKDVHTFHQHVQKKKSYASDDVLKKDNVTRKYVSCASDSS